MKMVLVSTLTSLVMGVSTYYLTQKDATTVVASTPTVSLAPDTKTETIFETKKVTQVKFTEDRVVSILDEIGEESAEVARRITELSSKKEPIYILINSPGGSVMDGALIISAMQASLVPVYTICLQLCASMAGIIHQYGTERYMVDRSFLMFHNASGGVRGTLPQMISRLSAINRYVLKMDAFIAKRAGLNLEDFIRKFDNELWMDAEDSTSLKFNDKIVSLHAESKTLLRSLNQKNELKTTVDLDWK